MQAFVCDICGKTEMGLPVGVFYDNTVEKGKNRVKDERRTDICLECVSSVALAIKEMKDAKADSSQ